MLYREKSGNPGRDGSPRFIFQSFVISLNVVTHFVAVLWSFYNVIVWTILCSKHIISELHCSNEFCSKNIIKKLPMYIVWTHFCTKKYHFKIARTILCSKHSIFSELHCSNEFCSKSIIKKLPMYIVWTHFCTKNIILKLLERSFVQNIVSFKNCIVRTNFVRKIH
jgi:RNAse (barnase) inhibitor barstar